MRLLVCGSRTMKDREWVWRKIDEINNLYGPIDTIIEGEAEGSDTFAREWAEENNVPVRPFPANWRKFGRSAGPRRNQQMLDEGKPDMALALVDKPIFISKGTLDMVRKCNLSSVPAVIFELAQKEEENVTRTGL